MDVWVKIRVENKKMLKTFLINVSLIFRQNCILVEERANVSGLVIYEAVVFKESDLAAKQLVYLTLVSSVCCSRHHLVPVCAKGDRKPFIYRPHFKSHLQT